MVGWNRYIYLWPTACRLPRNWQATCLQSPLPCPMLRRRLPCPGTTGGRKTGASRPALPSGEGQLRLKPRGNGHNPLGRSAFLATAVWPCGNGSVVDWSAATHGGAALGSSDVAWEDATETEVRVWDDWVGPNSWPGLGLGSYIRYQFSPPTKLAVRFFYFTILHK